MLYQLSYDPLVFPNVPHPTECSLCARWVRAVKANEVRVYVVRGRSSNRKCPYGLCPSEIDCRAAHVRTGVPTLFSL